MKRNQLVFFAIIGLAALIIGLGVALQALNGDSDTPANTNGTSPGNTGNKEPLMIEVAVNPLLEAWVTTAAQTYNTTNPVVNGRAVTVSVKRQESLGVWGEGTQLWSAQSHPLAWIPEANYVLVYANEGFRLPYEAYKPSLAQTPIIWGAYKSRSDVIVNQYGAFDANTVQQAAVIGFWEQIGGNSRWQYVKLAFARPDSTGVGLASLLTLMSNLNGSPTLNASILNDAAQQDQLKPIIDSVPNFSTLGIDPALVIATRGTSTGEIALLPESQWLANWDILNSVEPVQLFYPPNSLVLDFPYALWNGAETTADERKAVQAFGDFLAADAQQSAVGELGYRPATRQDLAQFSPFRAAQGNVQLELTVSEVSPADRPATLSLLRWFTNYRTAP